MSSLTDWLRKLLPKERAVSPAEYRAYTTEFDEEVDARDLLNQLFPVYSTGRAELEGIQAAMRQPSLARAQAVEAAIGLQERLRQGHSLGSRPLVTVLIDHSGSMRGPKAVVAAHAADVIGNLLQEEGIEFEILGFTTRSWKGGKSKHKWETRGRPEGPGRLCDLLHIVYRGAGASSRNWSWDLALLHCDDILKENVDGEAINWARARADKFQPSTWVCMVVSDGAAVDDSTLTVNPADYLEQHVRHTIMLLETDSCVRIGGLGIQYAVGRWYGRNAQADVLADAPQLAVKLLTELIWGDAPTT